MDTGNVEEVLKGYLKPFSEAFDAEIKENGYVFYVESGKLKVSATASSRRLYEIENENREFYEVFIEIADDRHKKCMIIMQPFNKPSWGVDSLFCSIMSDFYEEKEDK